MYGMGTTAHAATASTGVTGALASAGLHVWPLFAAITVVFAVCALAQLVSRPKDHRP